MTCKYLPSMGLLLGSLLLGGCSTDPWDNRTADYTNMMVHFSDEGDYELWYPSDWVISEPGDGVIGAASPDGNYTVSLVREETPSDLSDSDAYREVSEKLLCESYEGYITFEEQGHPCGFGGMDAVASVFRITDGDAAAQFCQIYCRTDAFCYVMTYTALPEDYESGISYLRKMANGFRFIDEDS